jgi:cytochrome P450
MTSTLREPATAPGALPLIGHALRMKRDTGAFFVSLRQDPITLIRLGRSPMYVVNDYELMREIMHKPDVYGRGGPIAERFRLMFGNGLGISDGEFHRRQRALVQPAFHRNRIIGYTELMSAEVAEHTTAWQDGQHLAMERELDQLALGNITRVLFAAETELDRVRFNAATSVVLGGLFRWMTDATGLLTRLPTPTNRRYREAMAYLRQTIVDVVAVYRASGEDRGDLLSMMVLAQDTDGRPAMSEQQLRDEVLTFFIAGSTTISNTLAWSLHELAIRPELEKRLHEETDQVLDGRPAGFEDLPKLALTRRILTETLRYRTQGYFQSRLTTMDTELGGYRIPRSSTVLYSFHALNHSPDIHAQPDTFDPDRWLPDRAKAVPRGAFTPFGLGVHGCVGEQFSWAEMIVSLATIAGRWRLEPVPGHQPKPKPAVTMPVDSLPMIARRRA